MPFYNTANLNLPLDAILLNNGYFYKKEKCSVNFLTMKNENDDLIIITRANNGHYLYFNPIDDKDRGNIYSFCKNRGVKIADLLGEKGVKNLEVKDLTHTINPSSLNDKAIEVLNTYKEFKDLDKSKNFFILKRFLSEECLQPFNALKQDKFHNVIVPTFILDKCRDINFINMAGFMNYLKSPIKRENAFIKQLCYGKKGLEVLKNENTKSSDIQNVIVCESIIDSLSLFELGKFESQSTLLCSTNGQITVNHCEILDFLLNKQAVKAKLIIGFDNDEKGKNFTQKLTSTLSKDKYEVRIPCLKDFNDDLMIGKLLKLGNEFDINTLESIISTKLIEPIQYFLDKRNVLLPDSFKSNLANALRSQSLLELMKPKCESFINTQGKKSLNKTLTQMKEFENNNLQRGR